MSTCPIPRQLKRRPRAGSLPIPYMVLVDDKTGHALFGFDDLTKKQSVIRDRLCGQCGNPLDKVIAFIGDEDCIGIRVFKEPAMHLPCARYVLQVCPYFVKGQHNPDRLPEKVTGAVLFRYGDEQLPPRDRCGIYLTRGYEASVLANGQIVLYAGEQVGTTLWYSRGLPAP